MRLSQSPSSPLIHLRAAVLLAAVSFLATLPACKLVSGAVNAPGKLADNLLGAGGAARAEVQLGEVQTDLMRFADTFATSINQASTDFAERVGTPEARIQALSWSIGQSSSAYTIASGSNPRLAVLDMIVLVTLGRMTHEEYWLPKVWGESDRPMLVAFTQLEAKLWEFAETVLQPAQRDAVRETLREWREQNPDMGLTAFVRLPMFEEILRARGASDPAHGGLFGDLLTVDPLAGLEPAVREIERTRLFAERSMFYVQRAPLLLSNQVELLSLRLLRIPEVQSALRDSQRISEAAASLADTAAKLPESVRVEREAAVKQISDELVFQRQGLVADLQSAEGPSAKLLGEARATLEAGTRMSTALQSTITTSTRSSGASTRARRTPRPRPANARARRTRPRRSPPRRGTRRWQRRARVPSRAPRRRRRRAAARSTSPSTARRRRVWAAPRRS
ncbi:MAG: hypothetical protein IPJ77_05550 [Planctomycetes bacterium]|nr:hypothetical protein [Planctomycetota bacterium]